MKKWEKNEKLQRLSHALNCVGRLARFAKKNFSLFFWLFFSLFFGFFSLYFWLFSAFFLLGF
jgi:hypothetical protein